MFTKFLARDDNVDWVEKNIEPLLYLLKQREREKGVIEKERNIERKIERKRESEKERQRERKI